MAKSASGLIGEANYFAFLFTAGHHILEGPSYAAPCEQAFLQALGVADPKRQQTFRILRGDILTFSPIDGLDRIIDAAKTAWNSVDLSRLDVSFRITSIYGIAIHPVSRTLAIELDRSLRPYPPYVGAIELLPTCTQHKDVLDRVVPSIVVARGRLFVSRWSNGESDKFGTDASSLFEIVLSSHDEFTLLPEDI